MKHLIFLLPPMLTLLFSCQIQDKRYTQQSDEIDTVIKLIQDYNNKEWDSWTTHYVDTATIYYNTREGIPSIEGPRFHQENDSYYSSRGFQNEGQEYEMVLDDQERTWVNYWGIWKGTLAATGEEFTIPVHLTYKFVNGKIAREYGYWDNAAVVLAIRKSEESIQTENNTIK